MFFLMDSRISQAPTQAYDLLAGTSLAIARLLLRSPGISFAMQALLSYFSHIPHRKESCCERAILSSITTVVERLRTA